VVVIVGDADDYSAHTTQADVRLIVEVSDATLRFDRGRKSAIYAEAGIPEYWILNLNNRELEVRRDPAPHPTMPCRFLYRDERILSESDTVTPLAAPNGTIIVADLLPRLSAVPAVDANETV
jgi:Uma2 family endonuclease